MELADKRCVACHGGIPPLSEDAISELVVEVPAWTVVEGHHLSRTLDFPDFVTALAFVNRAAEIAEAEAHHPDIYLAWGEVRVEIWTHAINGLAESDFVLAAKLDRVVET